MQEEKWREEIMGRQFEIFLRQTGEGWKGTATIVLSDGLLGIPLSEAEGRYRGGVLGELRDQVKRTLTIDIGELL